MFSTKFICFVWKDDKTFSFFGPYLSLMSFVNVPTLDAFLYIVVRITKNGAETIEIGGTSSNSINSLSGM